MRRDEEVLFGDVDRLLYTIIGQRYRRRKCGKCENGDLCPLAATPLAYTHATQSHIAYEDIAFHSQSYCEGELDAVGGVITQSPIGVLVL